MMNKYRNMSNDMQVVLDRIFTMIAELNTLDDDVDQVGDLIAEARSKYEEIKNNGIEFLTEDAGKEDGTFTEFMDMLEHTINYENNLKSCGKPDCRSTCMQEPIFNEGKDYSGCWNQTYRGEKCKNWLAAGAKADDLLKIGDHNSCRDPDNKGQAWCYLEDPSDGQTWDFCVDPKQNPDL